MSSTSELDEVSPVSFRTLIELSFFLWEVFYFISSKNFFETFDKLEMYDHENHVKA